jgi:hypothetical protein
MKFAVLGTDSDIVQLAAAARAAEHQITWLGDVRNEDAAAVAPVVGDRADRAVEWELLLDRGFVDGVFVGHGTAPPDLRAEQLKRLVAEAVPVLVVHPIFESVLSYYEIDMTRRETGAVVRHYNPVVEHPVLAEFADWIRDGHPAIGRVHQVTCDRRAADASRSMVLGHLARDVELLAMIGGDIRRVSAIGPGTSDASFASLQVQLTTANVASMRWSVGSTGSGAAGMQVAFLGERGTVTFYASEVTSGAPPTWRLETASDSDGDDQPLPAIDGSQSAITRFVAAVAEAAHERRADASTWDAATRDMEVVDAVELSLQKGRTIEVFQQQLTERLAFRGTMAALGCGLLLVAFLAVVAVAILGGAEGTLQQRLAPAWPLILLAVLAFFLLLQAVPMLVLKGRTSASKPPSPEPKKP